MHGVPPLLKTGWNSGANFFPENVTNVFKTATVIQCGIEKPKELLSRNERSQTIDPIKPQANTRGSRETWGNVCMILTIGFVFKTDWIKQRIVAEVLKGC